MKRSRLRSKPLLMVILLLLTAADLAAEDGGLAFTDVTEDAGLLYVQHAPVTFPDCISGLCEA